jgi:hypothetical protein
MAGGMLLLQDYFHGLSLGEWKWVFVVALPGLALIDL